MYAVLLENIKNPHYATINPLTMKTIKSSEYLFYAGELVDIQTYWKEDDKCNIEDIGDIDLAVSNPLKRATGVKTPKYVTISLTDYSKHERMFKLLYG